MTTLQWKRGTAEKVEGYAETALEGELVIETSAHRINLFKGNGEKVELPLLSDLPATVSALENDIGAWSKTALTKVSQLENDAGFWSTSSLTKISQLTNDSGFKTQHCTHCQYCQYCSQCSNCHNCNTIQCTTVDCTILTVQCKKYTYCYSNCHCTDG